MCGILFSLNINNEKALNKALDVAIHRGPDNQSSRTFNIADNTYFLGHLRLSIIDTTSENNQPLFYRNLAIIFNGEIYNFRFLRKILVDKGYEFVTQGDTEVIAAAYIEWGKECLEKFNGMFAFVILNIETGEYFIGRDRLGVKPLFICQREDRIIWASEIKMIREVWQDIREVNGEAVPMFLRDGYLSGNQTIWKEIKRVPPATYIRGVGADMSIKEYWNPNQIKVENSFNQDIFESLLIDSVRLRFESDVKIGLFLSGGVDSSLLAAIASQYASKDFESFTIGFENVELDESSNSAKIAASLGIINHNEQYNNDSVLDELPNIYTYWDEPFADSSALTLMAVTSLAKKHGCKVVLGADGGDELLAGYSRHRRALLLSRSIFWRIRPLNTLIRHSIAILSSITNDVRILRLEELLSVNDPKRLSEILNAQFTGKEIKKLTTSNWQDLTLKGDFISMLNTDYFKYQNADILPKLDIGTMSQSVEGREPFLDYRLYEYIRSCKDINYFGPNEESKYPLRVMLSKFLNLNNLTASKRGFSIPIIDAISDIRFQNYYSRLYHIENLRRYNTILDANTVLKYWKKFRNNPNKFAPRIYNITMLLLWLERNYES